jgi:hypothetical protein
MEISAVKYPIIAVSFAHSDDEMRWVPVIFDLETGMPIDHHVSGDDGPFATYHQAVVKAKEILARLPIGSNVVWRDLRTGQFISAN